MSQKPVLPYGRHAVDDEDVAAVVEVLRSAWLTTGSTTADFEAALAAKVGAKDAVSCSNGTAGLHLACLALGIGLGDAVIVPSVTFVATANAARLVGAEVVFADVDPTTALMGVAEFQNALDRARKAGLKVKAAIPVHLGGQCDDLEGIGALAKRHGIKIIEDACHALGTVQHRSDGAHRPIGACADSDLVVFSFHPVKTITSGEGGAVTTQDPSLARKLRQLRGHGLERDFELFENRDDAFDDGSANPWYYEMPEIGLNYRLSDINCALGLSQLKKLDRFVDSRRRLVARYDERLSELAPSIRPVKRLTPDNTSWHLMTSLIDFAILGRSRREVMADLKARGVGTQVHYIPVHHQPYYKARYGETFLPGADAYYRQALSLPLYYGITEVDVDGVAQALAEVLRA